MNKYPTENIGANEPSIIADIVAGTIADQNRDHKPGSLARRDVHSKSHGTFTNATLRIIDQVAVASGDIGIFGPSARTYPATVRLSNGAPGVGPDGLPNVRGVAVKVHDVLIGPKLLLGDGSSDCCDFLLANHKVSFHRHLEDYPEIRALMAKGQVLQVLKRFKPEGRLLLKAVLKLVKNPLTIDYYSQTPYMFGRRAVKYALIAQQRSFFFSLPNIFDRDYLRHAAAKLLGKKEARFTLCVQFQQENEPIEDPSVEWKGPLVPVAVLTIPRRGTHEPLEESSGEPLSFNPWRTLSAHRPLGWVNRVREAVYRADFEWRTAQNKTS